MGNWARRRARPRYRRAVARRPRLHLLSASLSALLTAFPALERAVTEDDLLSLVTLCACRDLEFDASAVALREEGGSWRIAARCGTLLDDMQPEEFVPAEDAPVSGSSLTGNDQNHRRRSARTASVCVQLDGTKQLALGYLCVERETQQRVGIQERALLRLLAFQARAALEALRDREERLENMRLAKTQRLQLEALLQASAEVYGLRQLDEVLQQIALAISSSSGFGGVVVYLYDERTDLLHARAFVGVAFDDFRRMRDNPLPFSTFRPLMRPEIQISRSYVYDHRKYELPPDLLASLSVPEDREWQEGQWHPLDSLTIPLQDREGRTIGLLSMDEPRDKQFPAITKLQALELFADACAVAIQQARLYDEMQQLAMTDPLTGLHNRRALEDVLRRELAHSRRNNLPCAVLFCDLDHFKLINDVHGHTVGDQVLQSVAGLFRQRLRRGDLAARYGGEEFVVVLPVTRQDQAVEVAEDLRRRVASYPWPARPTDASLTISVGVAGTETCPIASETEVIAAADKAMYLAKQQGRNAVARYEPGHV